MEFNLKPFLNEIDMFLAIVGIISSILLLIYLLLNMKFLSYYLYAGIIIIISCLFWLIIRNKPTLLEENEGNNRIYLILNIIYFIFFIGTILSFYLRDDLYERPLIYFIIIILMVGTVALEILFTPQKYRNYCLIISQIVIIGLNITYSQSLIFPDVIGVDPWWHKIFTENILKSGFIPKSTIYSNLPLFHLEIAATALINDLNYKFATLLSSSLILLVSNIVFIFLIGKKLFSVKIGLLASLFLVTANHQLYMAFWTIPNSIAAIFIPIIIYLLYKSEMKHIFKDIIVYVSMILVILTHSITSMALAIILVIGFLSYILYKKLFSTDSKNPIPLALTLFFIVAMLSWWTYISGHLFILTNFLEVGFESEFLIRAPIELLNQVNYSFYFDNVFNNLGMFLFFFISFIGCFYMISRRFGNVKKFIFVVIGLGILSIIYITIFLGKSIIEHRWWYFSQILFSIPLSLSISLLLGQIKTKKFKSIFLAGFTIILSFLMIMSPMANLENPILTPNTAIRYGLIESELVGYNMANNVSNRSIITDELPAQNLMNKRYNIYPFDIAFFEKNFSYYKDNLIIIREEIINNPFKFYDIHIKLDYNPTLLLDQNNYSKIYNSSTLKGYIKNN